MEKSQEFPGGVALVIGGSGGNGEAICHRFAESGSDVILTYHRNAQRATGGGAGACAGSACRGASAGDRR